MPFIGNKPTAVPLSGDDIQDGTIGLADLSATGTKDATTFLRGDNTFASAGVNTPAFEAYTGQTTALTDNVFVKATFDVERFDTNNTFSSSRFTPAVAGKYHCYTGTRVGNDGANTLETHQVAFYKNGSPYLINTTPISIFSAGSYDANNDGRTLAQTIDLDADDYVEVYVRCNTTVGSPDLVNGCFFGAYKIIE